MQKRMGNAPCLLFHCNISYLQHAAPSSALDKVMEQLGGVWGQVQAHVATMQQNGEALLQQYNVCLHDNVL